MGRRKGDRLVQSCLAWSFAQWCPVFDTSHVNRSRMRFEISVFGWFPWFPGRESWSADTNREYSDVSHPIHRLAGDVRTTGIVNTDWIWLHDRASGGQAEGASGDKICNLTEVYILRLPTTGVPAGFEI